MARMKVVLSKYRPYLEKIYTVKTQRVTDIWNTVDSDTIDELTDYVGYHQEFLKLFGFDVSGVDYDADISPELAINNLL